MISEIWTNGEEFLYLPVWKISILAKYSLKTETMSYLLLFQLKIFEVNYTLVSKVIQMLDFTNYTGEEF